MSDATLIGPWVRRFLLEHVSADRNFARNTQVSYRDTGPAAAIREQLATQGRRSADD